MNKIYLIVIEYFDGSADDFIGYHKTKEAAINWIEDNRPKAGRLSGYQYRYEEYDHLGDG